MPRLFLRHAKAVLPALLLIACLGLAGCAGQTAPGRDAETEALRQRVDLLERQNTEERAKMAEDLRAMRQDMAALRGALEEVSRSLGPLTGTTPGITPGTAPGITPGNGGGTGADAAKNPKSPRQALKDSLRNLVDASKEAVDRLTRDLDRQLSRPPQPEKAPEAPGKKGQQL